MAKEKKWPIKKLGDIKDISDRDSYDIYKAHLKARASINRMKKYK